MNKTLDKLNMYTPSKEETIKYAHLDISFPTSNYKWDEYHNKIENISGKVWKPFDWFHNNAITMVDHMNLNSGVIRRSTEERIDFFNGRHNLKYPKSSWNQYEDTYSSLQRWRELGDIWLVKSAESPKGYAVILITGIKEVAGVRYVEFMLVSKDLRHADDDDIIIESFSQSNIAYDLVLHPLLTGKLFENDTRLLHKIGSLEEGLIQKIRLDNFSDFLKGSTANKYLKNHLITKAFYDFETSILSQEVNDWIEQQNLITHVKLDIEFVQGLDQLKKYHDFLNKKEHSDLNFKEISTPYAIHLWKLNSSFKNGLKLYTDKDLGESDSLILLDKNTKKEKEIKLRYF
jgi:hypothetical protein